MIFFLQVYNFDIIAKQIGMTNGFFIGPGAGNSHSIGTNCEVLYTRLRKVLINHLMKDKCKGM